MANEKEIIEHLSSEITANIQKMSELRSKSNLAVFLGPYVMLGVVLVRDEPVIELSKLSYPAILAAIILIACFLGMGLLMAGIEKHNKNQCNRYRNIIVSLKDNPNLTNEQLSKISFPERFIAVYLLAYSMLILSFLMVLYLSIFL